MPAAGQTSTRRQSERRPAATRRLECRPTGLTQLTLCRRRLLLWRRAIAPTRCSPRAAYPSARGAIPADAGLGAAGAGGGVPGQGNREALFAPGGRGGIRARRQELCSGDADGLRQDPLLQPAGAERAFWRIPTRVRSTSSPPRRWRRTNLPNCTIWRKRLDDRFGVFTYDGDTPSDARKAIRERGHMVLSNPDMLHTGILPHHTKWMRLFENLRYIVLDELHTYRGVFGSHLANVLRRLRAWRDFMAPIRNSSAARRPSPIRASWRRS